MKIAYLHLYLPESFLLFESTSILPGPYCFLCGQKKFVFTLEVALSLQSKAHLNRRLICQNVGHPHLERESTSKSVQSNIITKTFWYKARKEAKLFHASYLWPVPVILEECKTWCCQGLSVNRVTSSCLSLPCSAPAGLCLIGERTGCEVTLRLCPL